MATAPYPRPRVDSNHTRSRKWLVSEPCVQLGVRVMCVPLPSGVRCKGDGAGGPASHSADHSPSLYPSRDFRGKVLTEDRRGSGLSL